MCLFQRFYKHAFALREEKGSRFLTCPAHTHTYHFLHTVVFVKSNYSHGMRDHRSVFAGELDNSKHGKLQ